MKIINPRVKNLVYSEAAMAELLNLPKRGDDQYCLSCGHTFLDTGWECLRCDYDNSPWYSPKTYSLMPKV